MKQLSLFDLPLDPKDGSDDPPGAKLWWVLRYKPAYEQAVADFVGMYGVEPIFYLSWPKHQIFLSKPSQAIVVEQATGLLGTLGRKTLWDVDYRTAKGFRPQDVAPQIARILSGAMTLDNWRPMVMIEIRVPNTKVDAFSARLASLGVFEQHWPAFRQTYVFRMFGEPSVLEPLIYEPFSGS